MAFSDDDWDRNPTSEHLMATMAQMLERGELAIIWEPDAEASEMEWRYWPQEEALTVH